MTKGKSLLLKILKSLDNIKISDKSLIWNTEIVEALELHNLIIQALASIESALKRTESRGAHSRIDYKLRNDKSWLKHSYGQDSMLKYYYKYYDNKVFAAVKTLEHILRLQWFLKVNNIKYKMFCGWNLFPMLPQLPRYPIEVRHLWKMIDWDNFWFHKKLGGISEWSGDNLPFKERFITGDRVTEDGNALDEHPSNIAHKKFAKEVVSKWINNT